MQISLDVLRDSNFALYEVACNQTGQNSGMCEIDMDKLRTNLLVKSIEREQLQRAREQKAAEQRVVEKKAAEQKAADEAAASALFKQLIRQGLRDCKENAELIYNHIIANAEGYISESSVNAAVSQNDLLWDPTEPLPNGEPRLPIDSNEHTMKAASVMQLKDLIDRRREATGEKYLSPRGSFGSKF